MAKRRAAVRNQYKRVTTENTVYVLLITRFWDSSIDQYGAAKFKAWGSNGRFFHSDYPPELTIGCGFGGRNGNASVWTSPIKLIERISSKQFDAVAFRN